MGMAVLEELLDGLEAESFLGQLDGSFGRTFELACRLGSGEGLGRLARFGFEKTREFHVAYPVIIIHRIV